MANYAAKDYSIVALLVCCITCLLAAMELVIKHTILVLDRTHGIVSIATRSFRGDALVTHPLPELAEAMVQTRRSDDNTTHRVALRLGNSMDQCVHPITNIYTSGDDAKMAAHAINRWLALPLDSEPTPT